MPAPKLRPLLRRSALLVLLTVGAALLQAPRPALAAASGAAGYAWGDFNADGFGDLAIGAPGEAIGSRRGAGAVHVLYGHESGLVTTSNQLWTQNTDGVPGTAEANDGFGASLAVGDFDGNGQDDLAIGSPGESIASTRGAGTVTVLYSSKPGALKGSGSRLLRQGKAGITGGSETGDAFGAALAMGNFDDDAFDDLAVGVPGEGVQSASAAGGVNILNGANGGLTGAGGEFISQASDGVAGTVESGDRFGHALTTGDFDDDGLDDLAIGVPFEGIDGHARAGAVYAVYGSADGPDPRTAHLMTQNTIFTSPQAEADDAFGFSLAAGNFNPDAETDASFDDLAIGAPGDLEGSPGAVNIVIGSSDGFVEVAHVWHQGKSGGSGAVSGTRESGDSFGYSLTANDFNGDGACDLAIGVPHEDSPESDEGGVNVIYSDGHGLEPGVGPSQFWGQDSDGVAGVGEKGDQLGHTVTSGDFDGDGHDDLVMGAPLEDLGSAADAGVLHVLYGADTRLDGDASDLWHQGIPGIKGTAENGDRLGGSAA